MKLGILADIHEHTAQLAKAIAVLQQHGADLFVALGDVFETGRCIDETMGLLRQVGVVGIWGHHDIGLCLSQPAQVRRRHSQAVLDFMGRLRPSMEIDGRLSTHVEPWLDPHKADDLGLEYKGRDLMVFHNVGNIGLGAGRIPQELKQDVIAELAKRAGLSRKSRSKMQASFLGKQYKAAVEEYDSFGESAFNLTLKERKKKAGG
jgi:hypothetical protein